MMPVYDKPMVYYPLATLMEAGIREVLIISGPRDLPGFQSIFGDGSDFGMRIAYAEQAQPNGLAEAFIIAEDFLAGSRSILILGDNLFYGASFTDCLRKAVATEEGAYIFGYQVANPSDYGVVEFDQNGKVLSLEEKPAVPKSDYAVPGVYCYDEAVVAYAKNLAPSARGELEITDLNRVYLEKGQLQVATFGRGNAWLDTGNPEAMLEAAHFVQTMQNRTNLMIGCIEEIAYVNGWIDGARLLELGNRYPQTRYCQYLLELLF